MNERHAALIATPIGSIAIESQGDALTRIRIGADGEPCAPTQLSLPILRDATEQLHAYFDGQLTGFDLPLAPPVTPRGGALRDAVAAIGYGETASYGELAAACGSSSRALGQACARNPFPILIPCHRVLGAGGKLGFYSAGDGPTTKTWLLDHERAHGKGRLI